MQAYTDFAALYDRFMQSAPYDRWCGFIVRELKKQGISDGLVCDLGAGTGEMTRRLRDAGFDMIGIDNSDAMLSVARSKEGEKEDILYLNQDMREFELYGTVRACVSICDSINYITEKADLTQVFKLVNNYLDPGGIFIFDFNTKHKYRDIIGDSTIAETGDDASFIWENTYYDDVCINEYDITFFVKNGENYRRFTETHLQRGYTLSEIKACIASAGLVFLKAYDGDSFKEPTRLSERIFVICKEKGK